MRALALTLTTFAIAACHGADAAPTPPGPVTFRWANEPVECRAGWDARATGNKCGDGKMLVVAYAPTKSDPKMSVVRYNGDHAGAPAAWTRQIDMVGEPVVVLAGGAALIASAGKDVVALAALDTSDGRTLATKVMPSAGAQRVQLNASSAATHLHVIAGDGRGFTVTVDPKTLALASPRDIPARAIRTKMDRTATSADGTMKAGAFEAVWDEAELVVRKAGGWSTTVVPDDRFRMQQVTLHAGNGRVYLTLHHAIAAGSAAYAFDATTGKQLWERHLTGIGPVAHSAYLNRLSAFLDGDQLVVQGVESGGTYICTVNAADGAELACVDHLAPANVFQPPDAKIHVRPLPPEQPLGPQVSKMSCVKSASPKSSLAAKPGAGMTKAKKPKAITWVEGTVVFPSASCKPKIGGGIAGDRVELDLYDLTDKPGAAVCECTADYKTATNKDSKVVLARVRGGAQVGRVDLKP